MSRLADGVTLYFIRHGQTDWNKVGRLQGQFDVPLNDLGREQAARNGRTLREMVSGLDGLDFVASPLMRTFETMEIARAAAGLPPTGFRTDERLMEVHYGHWEGHYLSEVAEKDPVGYRQRKTDKFNWRPRGGESYSDLTERVAGWLGEIETDVVVVSHGGVSRVLRGLVLEGLTAAEIPSLEVPQDRVMILRQGRIEWW